MKRLRVGEYLHDSWARVFDEARMLEAWDEAARVERWASFMVYFRGREPTAGEARRDARSVRGGEMRLRERLNRDLASLSVRTLIVR